MSRDALFDFYTDLSGPGCVADNVVPLRPSRDFAVRQAVLDALHEWYPMTIARAGLAESARYAVACGDLPPAFVYLVGRNYRAIAAMYDLRGGA